VQFFALDVTIIVRERTMTEDVKDFGLDQDSIEWVRKQREVDQKEANRKETLKVNLGNENFKYLWDNGMKDTIEKDPSILDNSTATKMAMQMTADKIQNAKAKASAPEPEVKQENQPPAVPSSQGSGQGVHDAYEQPIGNLRTMDVSKFKNLSKSGRLCAESLKI